MPEFQIKNRMAIYLFPEYDFYGWMLPSLAYVIGLHYVRCLGITPTFLGIRTDDLAIEGTKKPASSACGLFRHYHRVYLVSPVTYSIWLGESELVV